MQASFERLTEKLQSEGLATRWYKIPGKVGYGQLFEQYNSDEIYCLETHLGPSQIEGYETYGVVQVFLADYPSLSVMMLIERNKSDNAVGTHQPIFNVANDENLSKIFLPCLFTAFNELDPSGANRGIVVQLYNTKMVLSDLIPSGISTIQLTRRFKKDGQLALIAADFDDPLIRLIHRTTQPILNFIAEDIKIIPRTSLLSSNEIPVDNGQGGYMMYSQNSTAFDEAVKLAISYLDKHYSTKTITDY